MCDTTIQNGGSGETDAQVKFLIYHLLMAPRGVYKKTGIVDNPVLTILRECSQFPTIFQDGQFAALDVRAVGQLKGVKPPRIQSTDREGGAGA